MADSADKEAPISADESEKHKQILTDLRKRYRIADEADQHNRELAMEDVKFVNVPGYQWDENMKKERGQRPCWEFNKTRISNKRVINNMRANRPSGKVRGVEDGDVKTAEIYTGLIRNINSISDFDTIVDYAAKYQVDGGMGAWRIDHGYFDDDSFNQDLFIRGIPNPFTLFWDPNATMPLKQDSNWWILTEKIPKDEYEIEYVGKEVISFPSSQFDDDDRWTADEQVRVAEYWYKKPVDRILYQLADGQIIRSDSPEGELIEAEARNLIVNQREVRAQQIMHCLASGASILEEPKEWIGKHFPFVVIMGDYILIDGKPHWNGQTRFMKDAQRSYNVSRTAIGETIAQAPKAFSWATTTQAKGHEASWKKAHIQNSPYRLYNHDPEEPGPPKRVGGADVPIALINEAQMASEEINMVSGIYQADVGAPSNATSGRHEIAKQNAGHLATFDFEDNASKGVQYTQEILIDLIPKVYDSARRLRVLGEDGKEDFVDVNTVITDPKTGKKVMINDLSVGKYDVRVTPGPNFATKRQEAAELYGSMLDRSPDLWRIAGDLIFKAMDLPYADEISDRMRAMLPPEIQEVINKDRDVDIPPEIEAMSQQIEQGIAMVEAGMAEVEKEASEVEKDRIEVEKKLADLKADQADFRAEIAKEIASMVQKQSALVVEKARLDARDAIDQARDEAAGEADQIANTMAQEMEAGLNAIQSIVGAFNVRIGETMDEIKEVAEQRPRIIRLEKQVDEDGKMSVVPIYAEDEGAEDDDEGEIETE